MSGLLPRMLLWAMAAGSGLLAGTYFAFSAFVMQALAKMRGTGGVEAMQSINSVIVRTPFMVVFVCSTALSLGLLVWAGLSHRGSRDAIVAAGALTFLVGMFGVTLWGNVPLNDRLAALSPADAVASSFWVTYLESWTRLNHVRAVASAAASAMFIVAAVASGRR